jgi:hypothetical protein
VIENSGLDPLISELLISIHYDTRDYGNNEVIFFRDILYWREY